MSWACRAEVRPRATVRVRARVLISGALGSRRRQVLSLRLREALWALPQPPFVPPAQGPRELGTEPPYPRALRPAGKGTCHFHPRLIKLQGPTRSVRGGGPSCSWGNGRGPLASPSACSPLRVHLPPPAGSSVSPRSDPQGNRADKEWEAGVQLSPGLAALAGGYPCGPPGLPPSAPFEDSGLSSRMASSGSPPRYAPTASHSLWIVCGEQFSCSGPLT